MWNLEHRVVVVGFDGAPYALINRLVDQNKMPNLKSVARDGVQGPLKTVLPPQSLPAWPSFVTGMNPGRHGAYSFFRPRSGAYDLQPFSSEQIRGLTIWDYLTTLGRSSFLVNVPLTYPPYKIDGVMISGMPAPLLIAGIPVFPESLSEELLTVAPNYKVEISAHGQYDEGRILSMLYEVMEERAKVTLHLLKDKTWQFFMVVFTCSDRVEHVFWRYLDPSHPAGTPGGRERFGQAIDQFYHALDDNLGKILEVAGDEATTIVVSDHGHGSQTAEVGVNQLLAEIGALEYTKSYCVGLTKSNLYEKLWRMGLIKLAKKIIPAKFRSAVSTGVDYERTSAYCYSFGAINLNVKGREPQGVVLVEDYSKKLNDVANAILAYTDPLDGRPIAKKIYKRDEIYWGEALDAAPDLLVVFRDGYGPTSWNSNGKPIRRYRPEEVDVTKPLIESGGHHWFSTMDGIFFAKGPSIKRGATLEGASIIDAVPTVLHLMSIPIPANIDGKILEIFDAASDPAKRQPQHADAILSKRPPQVTWSVEEEKAVTKRLADLGYLG